MRSAIKDSGELAFIYLLNIEAFSFAAGYVKMFGVISRSKATRVPVLKFGTIHNHAALGKYRYGKLADVSPLMRLLRILCMWCQMRSGHRFGLTRGCLANPFFVVRRSTQYSPESLRYRFSPV